MNFILKSCWLSVVYHSLWVSVRVISTAQYVMVNKSYDPSDRKELEPVVEALAVNASTLIWLLLSAMCAARSIFYASHAHREGFLKKNKTFYAEFGSGLGLCIAFWKGRRMRGIKEAIYPVLMYRFWSFVCPSWVKCNVCIALNET